MPVYSPAGGIQKSLKALIFLLTGDICKDLFACRKFCTENILSKNIFIICEPFLSTTCVISPVLCRS